MTRPKWLRTAGLFLVVVWLLLRPSVARLQAQQIVVDGTPDSSQFPLVEVRAVVTNPQGVPVATLDQDRFVVLEDGRRATVEKVESMINPGVQIAVALVIDVSGSMAGEPLENAKEATNNFLDNLAPQDQAAIIAFRTSVNLDDPFPQLDPSREYDFTADHGALHNLVNGLTATLGVGKTCLYDATFKAVKMTARQSTGRRAVLVFTDGRETPQEGCSVLKDDDPINEARQAGIPVFTVGLGSEVDPNYLRRLALTTGGTYQQTTDSAELGPLFQSIADQLKQQYVVAFRSRLPADGAKHVLSIRVDLPGGAASGQAEFIATPPEVPGVQIPLPSEEEVTDKVLAVTPEIWHRDPVEKVEFYIDDELQFTATREPYTFFWETARWGGEHRLAVKVYDTTGDVGSASLTVKVAVPEVVAATTPVGRPDDGIGGGASSQTQPWVLLAGALGLVLVAGTGVLMARRRRAAERCPVCGRAMDPRWGGQCLFCAQAGTVAPAGSLPPPQSLPPAGRTGPTTLPEEPLPNLGGVPGGGAGVPGPVPTVHSAPAPGQPPSPPTVVLGRSPQALAYLIMEKGPHTGHPFSLGEGDTDIGRAPDNQIILDDPAVSGRHARIKFTKGRFFIHDLGATNPTRVNGQEAIRHQLSDDDRIQVGETVFVFKRVAPQ